INSVDILNPSSSESNIHLQLDIDEKGNYCIEKFSCDVSNFNSSETNLLLQSDINEKSLLDNEDLKIGSANILWPNDPALYPDSVSHTLLSHFVELGPCQPTMSSFKNNEFPKSKDSTGKLRSFHENFYFCKTLDNQTPVKRLRLCYSPSKDRIFCGTCKLFGLPKAKKQKLASIGSNDWTNL
ncbi:zinc finger MYM-type protein 5-like, partial [Aphis craccivora]